MSIRYFPYSCEYKLLFHHFERKLTKGRDTEDVAKAHILSLDEAKVPGNRRYLLASPEAVDLRSVVARMKHEYPELADMLPDVAIDEEGDKNKKAKLAKIDTSESDVVFGTEWKGAYDSIKEIVLDAVKWAKENGSEVRK